MKYARYLDNGSPSFGIVEDGRLYQAAGSGDLFSGSFERGREVGSLDAAPLLTPVMPGKIVAVGKNYAAHISEMSQFEKEALPEEPILFLKPPSALLPHGGTIQLMPSPRIDFEAELCLVIGREAKRVSEEGALDYVFGYTCGNDVSNRAVGGGPNGQWTRGKGYDTFCPMGPVIATGLDPNHLHIQSRLNGEVRQDTTTDHMIFSPAFLISFISNVMTLYPGDVIMTGTPEGVGSLQAGDRIEVEIEGIGTLRNLTAALT